MKLKKNTKIGKINIFILIFLLNIFFAFLSLADEKTFLQKDIKFVELNILDKVSSKTINVKLNIGKQYEFKNLALKVLKCKNSEFDDNPEVTAYLQVKDLNSKSNDEVFIFNGWTFASSPSLKPFDHPVYDIWLIKCY
tara:strand:+ start:682 stop:1095 length:414 start_codon:yes stop_codon:yes gene_type:complete